MAVRVLFSYRPCDGQQVRCTEGGDGGNIENCVDGFAVAMLSAMAMPEISSIDAPLLQDATQSERKKG
jgi:hypothetical protein